MAEINVRITSHGFSAMKYSYYYLATTATTITDTIVATGTTATQTAPANVPTLTSGDELIWILVLSVS